MKDIVIKDGLQNMDFEKITKMLQNTFWCPDIKEDEVKQGANNSALNVGIFEQDENQIGYARVISDKTRFAYITDVYIEEKFRKNGLGQRMIKYIINHEELKDVYQWLLITRDAHEFYQKADFKVTSRPLDFMEIRKDRSYY